MEIRPNFGGGSPGFIRGGVSFFLQGGVPDFPKQGRLYPSDPPRCTPMLDRQMSDGRKVVGEGTKGENL